MELQDDVHRSAPAACFNHQATQHGRNSHTTTPNRPSQLVGMAATAAAVATASNTAGSGNCIQYGRQRQQQPNKQHAPTLMSGLVSSSWLMPMARLSPRLFMMKGMFCSVQTGRGHTLTAALHACRRLKAAAVNASAAAADAPMLLLARNSMHRLATGAHGVLH